MTVKSPDEWAEPPDASDDVLTAVTSRDGTGISRGTGEGSSLSYVGRQGDVAPVKVRAPGQRPDIDGVRGLAVILVVAFHALPTLVPGGFVGVDLFFVISGYLITGTILRELDAGTFTYLHFYARRCRRIVPALVVVLIGTLLLGSYALLAPELAALGEHAWAASGFITNILLWQQADYFDAAAGSKPLLHLWSLGIEEQYYLLWPPLLLLAARFRRLNVSMLLMLGAGSFMLNVAFVNHSATAAFYLLPTRLWELLAGGILARLEVDAAASNAPMLLRRLLGERASPLIQTLKSGVGFALVLLTVVMLAEGSTFPGWWAVAPTFAGFLLISAGRQAWPNRVVLSSRPAVAIGLISYPLYLWHWPLLSFARIVEEGVPSLLIRLGAVLLAGVLAWLTWRLVEQFIQRKFAGFHESPWKMRLCVTLSLVVLASIAAVGGILQGNGGLPQWGTDRSNPLDALRAVRRDLVSQERWPQCDRSLASSRGLNWCHTAQEGDPTVALFGDSHTRDMFPGFATVFSGRGINTLVLGQSSCAPLLGVRSFLRGTREQCSDANRLAVEVLSSTTSVHTVILSSLGPYYFSNRSVVRDHAGAAHASNWILESMDRARGEDKPRLFEVGYAATIERLQGAGKQVVFLIDVPELDFDPVLCVDIRPVRITRRQVRMPCGVSMASVRTRQAQYREIVARLATKFPEMRVFDPLPYLCDSDFCSAMHDGQLLYQDGHHLSVFGGEYLSAELDRWLRTLD